MRRSRVIALIVSLFLVSSAAFAEVNITMLNSKGEIQAQLEDAAAVFSAENPGISLEVQPCPAGSSPFQAMTSLYASGNAPALAMVDAGDIPLFADKFLDLGAEKWVKDCNVSMDNGKVAGKLLAFPITVEGFGIIYNKAVLAKAGVDPAKIHTTKDLEAAFKKVQATGVGALVIGPMDWSLGAHYLGIAYALTAKNQPDLNKLCEDLKAGKVDVSKQKAFSGILDTFDVMKKYNARKADALAVTYDDCPALLGPGKVGFYFQGNWTWPQLDGFATDKSGFGYIPVPISNNAADFGNSQIPAGPTKFVAIDKEQNSPEQQAAAKKFIDWLVYSESGQDALVNKANVIMGFKNVAIAPKDPLAKSIKDYMAKGNTFFAPNIPTPDHWSKVGASMQKYLVDKIDRKGLYKEIQDYWKGVK